MMERPSGSFNTSLGAWWKRTLVEDQSMCCIGTRGRSRILHTVQHKRNTPFLLKCRVYWKKISWHIIHTQDPVLYWIKDDQFWKEKGKIVIIVIMNKQNGLVLHQSRETLHDCFFSVFKKYWWGEDGVGKGIGWYSRTFTWIHDWLMKTRGEQKKSWIRRTCDSDSVRRRDEHWHVHATIARSIGKKKKKTNLKRNKNESKKVGLKKGWSERNKTTNRKRSKEKKMSHRCGRRQKPLNTRHTWKWNL